MEKSDITGLSIFFRLLIAFLLVVTLISGSMTIVYYVFSKKTIENQTQDQLVQVMNGIHDRIRSDIDSIKKDIQILASNPLLDEYLMSSEIEYEINARSLERLFMKSMKLMPDVTYISFVDYAGMEKVRVDRTGRSGTYRDISNSLLFRDIASAPSGSIHIDPPYPNKDGEQVISFGINKTDTDIGEFGGAIIIEYDMQHFFRYIDEIKIFNENHIWVYSFEGELLKHPADMKACFDPTPYMPEEYNDSVVLKQVREGMVVTQDFFFAPGIPFLQVAISVPDSVLYQDVSKVLRFLSIVFLISLTVTILIVSTLSKFISGPIVKLANAAALFAKGDLSAELNIKTGGEVRMLVDSFNKMTSDIQKTTVSKDYFNNIIQSMFDPLIVVSPDYEISYWPRCWRYFKY